MRAAVSRQAPRWSQDPIGNIPLGESLLVHVDGRDRRAVKHLVEGSRTLEDGLVVADRDERRRVVTHHVQPAAAVEEVVEHRHRQTQWIVGIDAAHCHPPMRRTRPGTEFDVHPPRPSRRGEGSSGEILDELLELAEVAALEDAVAVHAVLADDRVAGVPVRPRARG